VTKALIGAGIVGLLVTLWSEWSKWRRYKAVYDVCTGHDGNRVGAHEKCRGLIVKSAEVLGAVNGL
jgi:hypothetical protein